MPNAKGGAGFLKQIAAYMMEQGGHDVCTRKFKILEGGAGRCIGELTVDKEHLNAGGTLHGGFTATLVDIVTTYALLSNMSPPGVTTDLRCSYLKAAWEGDVIDVEANLVHVTSDFAYIDCVLKKKSDGSIIAKGGQTKFIGTGKN